MKLKGLKMKTEKIKAINKFMFYGGNPGVLVSREIFKNHSTVKDKRAICKLTDSEFNSLEWELPEKIQLRSVSYARAHEYCLRMP